MQKINDFRVPEGKSARMTFSRRVRKNGKVEEFHPAESSSDEEQEEEEKEDVAKEENKEKNETESVKDEKLSQSEHGNERTSEEKADISGERDSIDADRGSESIHEVFLRKLLLIINIYVKLVPRMQRKLLLKIRLVAVLQRAGLA